MRLLQVRLPATDRVYCGNSKHNGHYKKRRISDSDWAQTFLYATVYFQDETYVCTRDLQSIDAVFGADLYHKNCIKSYHLKYDEAISKEDQPPSSQKLDIFGNVIKDIHRGMNRREGYTLSSLWDHANKITATGSTFTNREIKLLLKIPFVSLILKTQINQSWCS